MITEGGSILGLGLFFIQLTRSDNLDHLGLAIAKRYKRTESACCAVSWKTFGSETVLMTSVPQKSMAPSAVSMNIDQRAWKKWLSRVHNGSPTCRIHGRTINNTNKSSKLAVAKKVILRHLWLTILIKGVVRVEMILKTYTMRYKTWK